MQRQWQRASAATAIVVAILAGAAANRNLLALRRPPSRIARVAVVAKSENDVSTSPAGGGRRAASRGRGVRKSPGESARTRYHGKQSDGRMPC